MTRAAAAQPPHATQRFRPAFARCVLPLRWLPHAAAPSLPCLLIAIPAACLTRTIVSLPPFCLAEALPLVCHPSALLAPVLPHLCHISAYLPSVCHSATLLPHCSPVACLSPILAMVSVRRGATAASIAVAAHTATIQPTATMVATPTPARHDAMCMAH